MKISARLATRLWRRVPPGIDKRIPNEALRDWVDIQTGGELDALQLDLLTDWVSTAAARIRRHGGAP